MTELSRLILSLSEVITNSRFDMLCSVIMPLIAMNNLNKGTRVAGRRMMKLVAW